MNPMSPLQSLECGIPDPLPPPVERDTSVPHAPNRPLLLSLEEQQLAVENSLRYFPERYHAELASEFFKELNDYGHIYIYRLRPTNYNMRAYPLDYYPARLETAGAIQLMIQNNLDPAVAQFPHELVTYGGNGCVFSNWAQYLLTMQYLSIMNDEQTLVLYSGHPLGLFPSTKDSPRVVITNGMVIPNYSSRVDLERMYGLGVTQYGQMTAGSYCYIGPQGIVHGTTITLLNASRKYLGSSKLTKKVFVSSGLGGMSGAQGKATNITGAIGIIAEVNPDAAQKRLKQGWVNELYDNLDECIERLKQAKESSASISIAFLGNVVDLWERLASEEELLVDLGSDQTSLHNPYSGGYYPVDLTFSEANSMMVEDPVKFKKLVHASLCRQVDAINRLVKRGMYFWDYGNSFLLEASRAGADIMKEEGGFKYPSYVQEFMGDLFSLGFGPFRWICTSGSHDDLILTDKTAATVVKKLMAESSDASKVQYEDNYQWINSVEEHKLVVGSQARILYADAVGRTEIALAFNKLVREGSLSMPIVISRDHHDVSGTDSPYRETSNIEDGSMFTADMAVHNFSGLCSRGATWAALHNGGGTGWGEAINGGFGLVLDGKPMCVMFFVADVIETYSVSTDEKIRSILTWDVMNGVARRAWAGNSYAKSTLERAEKVVSNLKITARNNVKQEILRELGK